MENCHIISEVFNLLPLQNKYRILLLILLAKETKSCFIKPNVNPVHYLTHPADQLLDASLGTKETGMEQASELTDTSLHGTDRALCKLLKQSDVHY